MAWNEWHGMDGCGSSERLCTLDYCTTTSPYVLRLTHPHAALISLRLFSACFHSNMLLSRQQSIHSSSGYPCGEKRARLFAAWSASAAKVGCLEARCNCRVQKPELGTRVFKLGLRTPSQIFSNATPPSSFELACLLHHIGSSQSLGRRGKWMTS